VRPPPRLASALSPALSVRWHCGGAVEWIVLQTAECLGDCPCAEGLQATSPRHSLKITRQTEVLEFLQQVLSTLGVNRVLNESDAAQGLRVLVQSLKSGRGVVMSVQARGHPMSVHFVVSVKPRGQPGEGPVLWINFEWGPA